MKTIFGLVDCNNFYASCERVFEPKLNGLPIIVLSNNDGCVVARSNESKALGIAMGVPAFEIKETIEKNNVKVFSSNYALYADMSNRVMQTLLNFTPDIEIYSIDEAFLNLCGINETLKEYGQKIRETVKLWTGLPVSVGIASTKTLAKIANRIAKKSQKANGVLDLLDSPYLDKALEQTLVEDVWGVGGRTAYKLNKANIKTALELKNADIDWIQKQFGINGVRTVYELNGTICYQLEKNPPAKQSITVSRTFGKTVNSLDQLQEAISSYTARAAEKLREQKLAANCMTVFANTNRFNDNRYFNSYTFGFDVATSDTIEMLKVSNDGIKRIFKEGKDFRKCGVILGNLICQSNIQGNLFSDKDMAKSKRLMQTIDLINSKSANPLIYAAEGLNQEWKTKFNNRSKSYTTRWDEIPNVK